ncbi:hypothetical protein GXW71_28175 [Roseomonas hellenica]|uniref:Uncharacterized protein n=1 Tax=Plastoroseomonas hellenica TaxID=2687306 RepID=A0ABS5F6S2_9PROT|nr:hypothetical protein [Plastoroseomonas hellenica]MBR0668262.1 hypothetical protein [Plastoroseomonas hellenica]
MQSPNVRSTHYSQAYRTYLVRISDSLLQVPLDQWPSDLPDDRNPQHRERLMEVAMSAIRGSPGNFDGAKDAFYRSIRHDADLLWELFAPYRQEAVNAILAEAAKKLREQQPILARPGERQRATSPAGASAVAHIHLASLLDTFKIKGKPIGDLTARQAAEWADTRERDTRFVRMLVQNLPPDDPIRKWRTADQAREMFVEASDA